MTKPSATKNKFRKQHTPAFRDEALKLAQRIGVGLSVLSFVKSPFKISGLYHRRIKGVSTDVVAGALTVLRPD